MPEFASLVVLDSGNWILNTGKLAQISRYKVPRRQQLLCDLLLAFKLSKRGARSFDA